MRVESRLPFKMPGLSQKQVADAQIGYKVENLGFGRKSLQNINRIDNFPMFFSYINTEYRRLAGQMKSNAFDLHPIDVLTDLLIHVICIVSKRNDLFEPRNIDTNTDFAYNMVLKRFEGARFGKIVENRKQLESHSDARTFLEFLSKKTEQSTKVYKPDKNLYNPEEKEYQLYDWEEYDFELMNMYQDTFEECMKIIKIDDRRIYCSESNTKIAKELKKFDMNEDGVNTYMNNRFLAFMFILNTQNIYEVESLDNKLDDVCQIYFPFVDYEQEQSGGAKQPIIKTVDVDQRKTIAYSRTEECINYDLFASIYIQKSIKMIWVMYLNKNKLLFSLENFVMEQLFNLIVFLVHSDQVGVYILDQTCIMVSIYCYLKLCKKHNMVPKMDVFALIIFAPYYVLFM